MCGIIGITSFENVQEDLINSLSRLEYRGYDSSGIATISDGKIFNSKAKGKLANLSKKLKDISIPGHTGIGHTRWATHGKVSEENAHPHVSGRVAIVHNGIIENFKHIQKKHLLEGRSYLSSTDSEVIAHLFDIELSKTDNLKLATLNVLNQLKGAFAFVVLMLDKPDTLIAARHASPLAIGKGENLFAVGSDGIALAGIAQEILFLNDGDFAIINNKDLDIYNAIGEKIEREKVLNNIDASIIGKGNYRHFMQKEIHEQPETIAHSIAEMYTPEGEISPELLKLVSSKPKSITILAAGTSHYAGMIGKYWIESISKISVNVETASEYRYRSPFQDPKSIAIVISQSGESLDTLMAMRHAKDGGMKTVALVNSVGSTIDREADFSLYTRAGAEIAVASTKAFTSQLSVLLCISIAIAEFNHSLDRNKIKNLKSNLFKIPGAVAKALSIENQVMKISNDIKSNSNCLYLARGSLYPLALEGALKLKEVSYIHAEGFSAGEMKHGPIALIEEELPVISLIAKDHLSVKTISNLREALARGAKIIVFVDEGAESDLDFATEIIHIPHIDSIISPIIMSIPIQLLAYHTAVSKGTDVDQPKNLAKSVTVE